MSMESKLIVPAKCRVGFQNRANALEGVLGFVVRHDAKGKISSLKNFEGWRDKTIDPVDFDNVPTEGFVINIPVRHGDYWNAGVQKVRVHDPRGFEIEIVMDNLIHLIENAVIDHRTINGKLVYAWSGNRLVLLSASSEQYAECVSYTARQDMKVSAKDLIVGATYRRKKSDALFVYMGKHKIVDKRFNQYENVYSDNTGGYGVDLTTQIASLNDAKLSAAFNTTGILFRVIPHARDGKSEHVFWQIGETTSVLNIVNRFTVESVSNMCEVVDTNIHADYDSLISALNTVTAPDKKLTMEPPTKSNEWYSSDNRLFCPIPNTPLMISLPVSNYGFYNVGGSFKNMCADAGGVCFVTPDNQELCQPKLNKKYGYMSYCLLPPASSVDFWCSGYRAEISEFASKVNAAFEKYCKIKGISRFSDLVYGIGAKPYVVSEFYDFLEKEENIVFYSVGVESIQQS